MKKIFLTLGLTLMALSAWSQNISYHEVVDQLVDRSLVFRNAADQMRVEQQAPLAGSLLADPEVSGGFYWGSPSEIGHRWDLSVTQSFDMPSSYIRRNQLRHTESDLAQSNGLVQLKSLVAEVQMLCSDIVLYNAKILTYVTCVETAQHMAQLYNQRLEAGDCSILEYNRVQLELTLAQNRLWLTTAEREQLYNRLTAYNNGEKLLLADYRFDLSADRAHASVDSYVAGRFAGTSPAAGPSGELLAMQQEYLRDSVAAKVARSQWLPKVEAGYASENVVGETFRGVTVGLTLPIWNNAGQVKQANLKAQTTQSAYQTAVQQNQTLREALLQQADLRRQCVETTRSVFNQYTSLELLQKALDAGELSLESYLQQREFYIDAELELLEAEHALDQTYIQLQSLSSDR